jgi:hypothetical protein
MFTSSPSSLTQQKQLPQRFSRHIRKLLQGIKQPPPQHAILRTQSLPLGQHGPYHLQPRPPIRSAYIGVLPSRNWPSSRRTNHAPSPASAASNSLSPLARASPLIRKSSYDKTGMVSNPSTHSKLNLKDVHRIMGVCAGLD